MNIIRASASNWASPAESPAPPGSRPISTRHPGFPAPHPTRYRRPGIVAVPLDAETDLEIAFLANLITLTPGSLCVDISEDRRTMYIHAMFVDDPDSVRSEIKGRFERWVLVLLR